MTIAIIRTTLTNKLNSLAATYGENATLSAGDNTSVTDQLATLLDTVNPNHDYPPVVKS